LKVYNIKTAAMAAIKAVAAPTMKETESLDLLPVPGLHKYIFLEVQVFKVILFCESGTVQLSSLYKVII